MPFSTTDASLFRFNSTQFDFDLSFEQLFFSIVPSAIFIAASSWSTIVQIRRKPLVAGFIFQVAKATIIGAYAALELILLVCSATGKFEVPKYFVAASALKLAVALLMICLSFVDHSRSPKPSTLICAYLALSLLFDATQARTLFLTFSGRAELAYSSIFTAAIALEAVVLLLEAKQKSAWVRWEDKMHSPEETSSIFSLAVFSWLNKLFIAGYKNVLTVDDLYPLDIGLKCQALHERFANDVDYARMQDKKYALAFHLAHVLAKPLLLPVLPRLFMVAFTLCQALFLEALVSYLGGQALDPNIGYGLIGAAFFIYSGIAISMGFYWYYHNRARTMARAILVAEIFNKATQYPIGRADDNAALTLMSTDVERIMVGFRNLHEIWAGILQASIAAWLLYYRVGTAFVAAFGTVLLCFAVLAILMNFTGDSQREWMAGNQRRVGLTAVVISSMKSLKLSGLTSAVEICIQKLREKELAAGILWRKIFIASALLGFIPQQVFEGVPKILSGTACLGRIQAYLGRDSRRDYRLISSDAFTDREKIKLSGGPDDGPVIQVDDGVFGWEAERPVLRNVELSLAKQSLTLVIGPVGSGKSTLCKALLGEIPINTGRVVYNNRVAHIGFCEQVPFLSNTSIRENIQGMLPYDHSRYIEVITATALHLDFAALPAGDLTNVGSDGVTLSGGQKQRISLARALYLHSDLLVLDDVLSGLDANTERHVMKEVFASNGLLRRRRATAILCTHSLKNLPIADHVVVLSNGTIVEQGSVADLLSRPSYLENLGLQDRSVSDKNSVEKDSSEAVSENHSPDLLPAMKGQKVVIANGPDASRQYGDKTVYKHYAKSMGNLLCIGALLSGIGWGFFTNFPTIWLTFWTNDATREHASHTFGYYAGIYAALQICALVSLLTLTVILWVYGIRRAGAHLHNDALRTLLRAPLQFFSTTDTGAITNLFSQDLNLIDTELPEALLNTMFCVFQAVGQAGVMLTSSVYLAIAYPFLGGLLYVLGKFYLRTSRQLRFLDLEAKTPLYTHFLDVVKGIVTIRAFGYSDKEVQKNIILLDQSQRPAYLLLMIQEWLNLVLNLVVMVFAVAMTALAVELHGNSAFAGAALYSLITLGENLAGIVLYWTRMETSIGAIARLNAFNKTVTPEDLDHEDILPPQNWPLGGVVEIDGVYAGYNVKALPVDVATGLALRDVSLTIQSGEKVAICGRTGSGKSSLVGFLLKLLDPVPSPWGGVTTIDGLKLDQINRSALRQRIIAVPQDPVFLPDGTTFMENLDPDGVSTAIECEAVLADVGLWEFIRDRGGSSAPMWTGTLSAGQRQLLSVGRALLRRRIRARMEGSPGSRGILILDEVSSSVDFETEKIIQELLRAEFKHYTVIAVSHRLDMILDFDRVVVMDAGKVVEVGNPASLARQPGTRFAELANLKIQDTKNGD